MSTVHHIVNESGAYVPNAVSYIHIALAIWNGIQCLHVLSQDATVIITEF